MKQTHYEQPSNESNVLKIGCRYVKEVEPTSFVSQAYPSGVCFAVVGYNPESVIRQLLEEYVDEKVQEFIKNLS